MPRPWIAPALSGTEAGQVCEALRQILAAYRQELPTLPESEFKDFVAAELARAAGKKGAPWRGQILTNTLSGAIAPSHKLALGASRLGAMLDGLPRALAQARRTQVYALGGVREGSLVCGESRRCASPDCLIWFVPNHPRRRYCYQCRPAKEIGRDSN